MVSLQVITIASQQHHHPRWELTMDKIMHLETTSWFLSTQKGAAKIFCAWKPRTKKRMKKGHKKCLPWQHWYLPSLIHWEIRTASLSIWFLVLIFLRRSNKIDSIKYLIVLSSWQQHWIARIKYSGMEQNKYLQTACSFSQPNHTNCWKAIHKRRYVVNITSSTLQ